MLCFLNGYTTNETLSHGNDEDSHSCLRARVRRGSSAVHTDVSVCSPDEFKFGCTSLRVPQDLLYHLRNDVTVSPNGVAFVKVRPCCRHINEV